MLINEANSPHIGDDYKALRTTMEKFMNGTLTCPCQPACSGWCSKEIRGLFGIFSLRVKISDQVNVKKDWIISIAKRCS